MNKNRDLQYIETQCSQSYSTQTHVDNDAAGHLHQHYELKNSAGCSLWVTWVQSDVGRGQGSESNCKKCVVNKTLNHRKKKIILKRTKTLSNISPECVKLMFFKSVRYFCV